MRGFTLIEVVITVLVGVILTSIAIKGFGDIGNQTAARGARQTFAALHARARAHAVERGRIVRLQVDATGDSVWITRGAEVLESIRFADEYAVDITATQDPFTLCMNSRGFADTDCNDFSSPIRIAFTRGTQTYTAELLPLGQLRW
jgi:prepilin-type N-terminal cleavage/methylation domain-containing protein